ncbi:hypothetical protein BDF21DRAFT_456403 [Thamnidium elegans]|uniref:PHD-type domain-containing protein n=1 Tax=Thamnidium elegans TaxID=101142 RepID=A0A8H7VPG3_9FUNG|nr:hypothetical protein INT48_000604 [Thamnidium elegans]KAI8054876.1 hypothetical protein BDF21DRAFT_456403 [Thamnidium elegans]
MKFNSATTIHTSKVNRVHKPTPTIGAKRSVYDVNLLAKRLKSRLSNAANNLFGSDPIDRKHNRPEDSVAMSPPAVFKNTLIIDTSLPPSNSFPTPETSTPPESDCASPMESSAIMDMSSAHTQLLLANLHWSEERKPMLRNLDLLKHYLTFISQEINSVDFEDELIKLSFPSDFNLPSEQNETAKLAASLIEQHVLTSTDSSLSDYHYSATTSYLKDSPKKVSDTNRRRGRPSKSLHCDITKPQQRKQRKKRQHLKKKQEKQFYYQDGISCICSSPFEEFGTMVQCDDCLNWLHLECLDLDEKALEETFRCPCCFIKIDREDDTKLISGLTWRYAARHKSEEIACYKPTEEDEDEYDEFDNRIAIDHTTSSLGIVMDYDLNYECSDEYSSIPSPDDFPSLVSAHHHTPTASPTMSFNDPWDLSLSSGASQYSQQEVGTPQEYINTNGNWLVPPCAENVFLCQNDSKPTAPLTRCSSPPPTPAEPSIVCAQELPEFNFWEINNSPSVAPTAVSVSSSDEIPDFNLWDF